MAVFGSVEGTEKTDPHFRLLTDFVYLQRSQPKKKTIAVDSDSVDCESGCFTNSVLNTNQLTHGYEPGIHADLAYFMDQKSSYDLGFLYLWELDHTATRKAKGVLSVPFRRPSFTRDFTDVDSVTASYKSLFYTGELNYWRSFSSSPSSYFGLSTVFGIRFANLKDRFNLEVNKGLDESHYKVSAKNGILGPQVGFNFQIRPNNQFYWDLLIKAGANLNRISSKVFLGDVDDTVTLRNFQRQVTQTGVFTEVALGLGYRPLDWMSFRAGYQMLYFGGLALGPNQLSFSSAKTRSSAVLTSYDIADNGYIILYGIYSGLVFSF